MERSTTCLRALVDAQERPRGRTFPEAERLALEGDQLSTAARPGVP
ncbi:hypothetical protein [Rubrivirga sp.]